MTDTRLFFATDIHGSDKCFLKFLNAGKFYKAQVAILGGDLTGKVMIPIARKPDGSYAADFLGERLTKVPSELASFEKTVNNSGYYPYVGTEDELLEVMSSPERLEGVMAKLAIEKLKRWIDLAEQRLKGAPVTCYVTAGNDDRFDIDPVLEKSNFLRYVEGKAVWIDKSHEMIATGYANVTPWNCPRDVSEEQLGKKIDEMAEQVTDFKTCIFTLHSPPHGSGLDTAMEIDRDLKPVTRDGTISMIPVGSKAVSSALGRYQPLLGLHGHIHEGRGFVEIGRTLCINPGSEYSEGILRGALIDLENGKIKNYVLTCG